MDHPSHWLDWTAFVAVLLATMILDRLLCARTKDRTTFRDALSRSVLWLAVGMGFTGWVIHSRGLGAGLTYLTAYLVEKSLSVDNLFVFLVIFRHFGVTGKQQERVLFWGVFGAVVLRAIFIVAGTAILHRFHFTFYVFGGFLVLSGLKLLKGGDKTVDPEKGLALRIAKRVVRTATTFDGARFITKQDGKRFATPLLLVLVVVELTDVVFAVDSVPAVLGISNDLYVVYTSNVMAILGLRALYFLLSGMMGRFHKLDWALASILIFVGLKMLTHDLVKVPNWASLAAIAVLLGLGVGASMLLPPPAPDKDAT